MGNKSFVPEEGRRWHIIVSTKSRSSVNISAKTYLPVRKLSVFNGKTVVPVIYFNNKRQ